MKEDNYSGISNNQDHVTIDLCTRNRYFSTLPLTLYSISIQRGIEDYVEELIIYDDSDTPIRITEIPTINYILHTLPMKWRVIIGRAAGNKPGQVTGHQIIKEQSTTDYIWRIDDDEVIYDTDFFIQLYRIAISRENRGAVSYLILNPLYPIERDYMIKSTIKDINKTNYQWMNKPDDKSLPFEDAEHLHSSFIYDKRKADDYPSNLSEIGHREETIFTHNIFRKGYELIISNHLVMYHFRNPEGGLRSSSNEKMFQHDNEIFADYLKEIGVTVKEEKLVILNNGIGDHFAFKSILPEMIEKYPEHQIVIACCNEDVFFDYKDNKNIKLISINSAETKHGKSFIDSKNIYKFMGDSKSKTLVEAYRRLYV